MVVGIPLQMRNIGLPLNLILAQIVINLSSKLGNLGVVFNEKSTLRYQAAAVKKQGYSRSYKHCKNIGVYR